MQVGSLGDIVFETSEERLVTPHAFSKERSVRYEDHLVQGDFPRSEYLAPDLTAFEMSIRLNASFGVDPVHFADQLSLLCTRGEVLRLIVAGWNLGKVTIRSVKQTWRHLAPGGHGVQAIDLAVSLKGYV